MSVEHVSQLSSNTILGAIRSNERKIIRARENIQRLHFNIGKLRQRHPHWYDNHIADIRAEIDSLNGYIRDKENVLRMLNDAYVARQLNPHLIPDLRAITQSYGHGLKLRRKRRK